jgi:hypothetical protein
LYVDSITDLRDGRVRLSLRQASTQRGPLAPGPTGGGIYSLEVEADDTAPFKPGEPITIAATRGGEAEA